MRAPGKQHTSQVIVSGGSLCLPPPAPYTFSFLVQWPWASQHWGQVAVPPQPLFSLPVARIYWLFTSMNGGPGWGMQYCPLPEVDGCQSPPCRAAGSPPSCCDAVAICDWLASSIPNVSTCILSINSSPLISVLFERSVILFLRGITYSREYGCYEIVTLLR